MVVAREREEMGRRSRRDPRKIAPVCERAIYLPPLPRWWSLIGFGLLYENVVVVVGGGGAPYMDARRYMISFKRNVGLGVEVLFFFFILILTGLIYGEVNFSRVYMAIRVHEKNYIYLFVNINVRSEVF